MHPTDEVIQARRRIQLRLDTLFELRGTPTRELQRMAVRRGVRAWGERGYLMRVLYWDIVDKFDCTGENHETGN